MLLHLGVIDLPYKTRAPVAKAKKGKANKPRPVQTGDQTTGDVAHWLENKYGVMSRFAELHQHEIVDLVADSVAGAIESLMGGAPVSHNPLGPATSAIETLFKFTYLDMEEIVKTGVAGVPTQAAKDGVDHRLKHPRAKANPRRQSFIDTGLYESSFKVWSD